MSILKFFSSKEKYNSIITFYSIMNLDEVLHYRRSVERMIEQTDRSGKNKTLSGIGNISSQQLGYAVVGFYHITQPELLTKVSRACLDQKATSTASQIVVFRGAA